MIVLDSKTIEVIKFESSGVAALCTEVADFVRGPRPEQERINVESARFVHDRGARCFKVVFDRE